jgi:23S rRNA pseudouridine1911/1915/1917 synthase
MIPLVDPAALSAWIIHEDDRLLVVNKPGWLVCHPSKAGPWSSLVGACRAYCGLERIHLVNRLDRETSGVVVLAKDAEIGAALQKAISQQRVEKTYRALLCGELKETIEVDQPLGRDHTSEIWVKQAVSSDADAKPARTRFSPLRYGDGYTYAEVELFTGRLHQIRAHAAWLGCPVLGDKIYGPDPGLYLELVEHGLTPELEAKLIFPRQALHAYRWATTLPDATPLVFEAALPGDMQDWLDSPSLNINPISQKSDQ